MVNTAKVSTADTDGTLHRLSSFSLPCLIVPPPGSTRNRRVAIGFCGLCTCTLSEFGQECGDIGATMSSQQEIHGASEVRTLPLVGTAAMCPQLSCFITVQLVDPRKAGLTGPIELGSSQFKSGSAAATIGLWLVIPIRLHNVATAEASHSTFPFLPRTADDGGALAAWKLPSSISDK